MITLFVVTDMPIVAATCAIFLNFWIGMARVLLDWLPGGRRIGVNPESSNDSQPEL
jgi:hypothetical protein